MKRILSLSLLVFIAASCSRELVYFANQSVSNEVVNESIAKEYKPEKEYHLPPKKGEVVADHELEGTWSSPGGLDYTSIVFQKTSSGKYSVKFSSGGCLADWTLDRQATYEKGIIIFDKPVEEYLPALYTKMYTIRFKDNIYLLASERIKDFEEDDDPGTYEMWLLKKDPNNAIKPDQ